MNTEKALYSRSLSERKRSINNMFHPTRFINVVIHAKYSTGISGCRQHTVESYALFTYTTIQSWLNIENHSSDFLVINTTMCNKKVHVCKYFIKMNELNMLPHFVLFCIVI